MKRFMATIIFACVGLLFAVVLLNTAIMPHSGPRFFDDFFLRLGPIGIYLIVVLFYTLVPVWILMAILFGELGLPDYLGSTVLFLFSAAELALVGFIIDFVRRRWQIMRRPQ